MNLDSACDSAVVTSPGTVTPARSQGLLLSIFPGIDLLGKGFEAEGYCVVRGPDIIWGGNVFEFHPMPGAFVGVFGGSPCQDFSRIRRAPPTGNGIKLLGQFERVVSEAGPEWFLLENVPGVPDIIVPGYAVQRFNLNASECGAKQNRLRCFQFGRISGNPLVIHRGLARAGLSHCCLATEGTKEHRRAWSDFCELQGLLRDFDLPGLSRAAKYRAVGNGVPVQMARVIAAAIKRRAVTPYTQVCICECGRPVRPGQTMATAACRKRMERKRKVTDRGVTGPTLSLPGKSQKTNS